MNTHSVTKTVYGSNGRMDETIIATTTYKRACRMARMEAEKIIGTTFASSEDARGVSVNITATRRIAVLFTVNAV